MRINLLKHRNMGLSTIVAAYPLQKEIMGNKYDITPETQERLDNDFTYHSPKEDQPGSLWRNTCRSQEACRVCLRKDTLKQGTILVPDTP